MLREHNYSSHAFLPSDGQLLYCALFGTHTAQVNWIVVSMWKCTARDEGLPFHLGIFLKE
jgi:hypothetical protein